MPCGACQAWTKSAQAHGDHLLERTGTAAVTLARIMAEAMERLAACARCPDYLSEQALCGTAQSEPEHQGLLCVIEHPSAMVAIEQATGYRGLYFSARRAPSRPWMAWAGRTRASRCPGGAPLAEGRVQELILAV